MRIPSQGRLRCLLVPKRNPCPKGEPESPPPAEASFDVCRYVRVHLLCWGMVCNIADKLQSVRSGQGTSVHLPLDCPNNQIKGTLQDCEANASESANSTNREMYSLVSSRTCCQKLRAGHLTTLSIKQHHSLCKVLSDKVVRRTFCLPLKVLTYSRSYEPNKECT